MCAIAILLTGLTNLSAEQPISRSPSRNFQNVEGNRQLLSVNCSPASELLRDFARELGMVTKSL